MRTLLLNKGYEPIEIIPWQDAITLWWVTKAEILSSYEDKIIRSCYLEMPTPAVLRLKTSHRYRRDFVPFERHFVYARDQWTCFGAGTLILMANGSQRPIEDVLPGDRIIDAFGQVQSVVSTGSKMTDRAALLRHRGSTLATVVTVDHPFLNATGDFTEIGTRPEYLVFPRKVNYELPSAGVFDAASFLSADRWLKLHLGRVYVHKRPAEVGCPAILQVTPQLAYIMGLLCAEGSAYVGKTGVASCTRFTFHIKERETLAKDVVDFFTLIGFPPRVVINPEHSTCVVHIGGQSLARILYDQVGVGIAKKIPWQLIGPYHAEFLAGLFKGDAGIYRERKKVSLQLVAKDLIFGAQSMLWGVGIYPTVQFAEKREKHRENWTLVLQGENYSRFMQHVLKEDPGENGEPIYGDDRFIYRKFQELEPISVAIPVHNLETTGTHSYIANGLAVHNCQYCGNRFPEDDLSYDHVIPECRGGKTRWDNIVTACSSCNSIKDDRTPEEAGMPLLRRPKKPSWLPGVLALLVHKGEVPPQWADWVDWLLPVRRAA